MKIAGAILIFLISGRCWAQAIEVIVPTQPVVVGTAFQVQYVITEPAEFVSATTPTFDSCRLISGPNIYKGNAVINGKLQAIQNIAYTLVPTTTGVLRIGGIKVSFKNGFDKQSTDAGITVTPQPKASFSVRSSYTDVALYAPSAKKDREQLINENLFIKTEVNKKSCYVGEPVVATFKLYSRLQSSSEAEKSPAFYGFSVLDILNINEAHTAVETVNGKIFNTSILRQVQLYPVQPGNLTIDEMYVRNEIDFDDSITHFKTKVEKEIVTQPITITVKPLPATKPEDFTGAVGRFSLEAHLEKEEIPANGQGKLVVAVKGKGNFIQFGPPVVRWQKGIEPFEPVVKDQLNKNTAPIEGERIYEFGFAVDSMGRYAVPPLSFSYFDMTAGGFKQLTTDSLDLHVTEVIARVAPNAVEKQVSFPYIWIVLLLAVVSIGLFVFLKAKRQAGTVKQKETTSVLTEPNYIQQIASLDLNELTVRETCVEIQRILSSFSKTHASLLSTEQKKELQSILQECQLVIYSHMDIGSKKEALLTRAINVLKAFK